MKQFNNRILLIILLVLVGGFIITRLFRSPSLQSNLDGDIVKIDTGKIDQIILKPLIEPGSQFTLTKHQHHWKVSNDQVTSTAKEGLVKNLLGKISSLKAERIVTRKKEKWDDYKVDDSTGTTAALYADGRELSHFVVGKESGGVTYLRLHDDDAVYAMNGSFATTFNQKFKDWRDQTFIRIKPDSIRKITFRYPADSGFVLTRNDRGWRVNDIVADSAKISNYLNKLRFLEVDDFADEFKEPGKPDVEVSIEANAKAIHVKGWKTSFAEWIFHSDLHPDVYFLDKGNVVADDLLIYQNKLVSQQD